MVQMAAASSGTGDAGMGAIQLSPLNGGNRPHSAIGLNILLLIIFL
jgi:hypothetical protein